jgi:alkanesulfonate monooxygenase SsuD/methylene tetrahydromethanopterin reductase-like flavin-dependent oxidoreductase (luciferase family)
MQYGVVMFPTDYAIRPDELARAVETRGFESLWVPEHTHIPASRKSPRSTGTATIRSSRSRWRRR